MSLVNPIKYLVYDGQTANLTHTYTVSSITPRDGNNFDATIAWAGLGMTPNTTNFFRPNFWPIFDPKRDMVFTITGTG